MNLFAPTSAEAAGPTATLAELLSRRERTDAGSLHRVRFDVSPDWQQGRTTFGGVLSALAVQAMRDVCGSDWPLRALQTNFVGPVSPGRFDIEVVLLRQGKNIRQVQARVLQADEAGVEQVGGVLLGVFGAARTSTLPHLRPDHHPVAKDPDSAFLWPFVPGITPAFTQHLEFRQAEGGMPFTGSDEWHSRTHVRLRAPGGIDNELQSVLLADAGPTPALAQLNGFAPASSVSWALELRPVELGTGSDTGFWRMDKDALATGDGYVNEKTTLWTPDGQLAALGYQVVAVYG
ncbi:acyl-CoA thioesterase [Aquabacterium commune]|uniref:Acyl-CoA thioesterase n=1 Tax=Aquabacterium commune TaxID=70586 RepID=A0A4R6RNE5_9BURK|nr:thioesterase family protein [Aquabacterium commune]TDP88092.1 acyl-CoA thioesterase [Aquabacterium commune]